MGRPSRPFETGFERSRRIPNSASAFAWRSRFCFDGKREFLGTLVDLLSELRPLFHANSCPVQLPWAKLERLGADVSAVQRGRQSWNRASPQ